MFKLVKRVIRNVTIGCILIFPTIISIKTVKIADEVLTRSQEANIHNMAKSYFAGCVGQNHDPEACRFLTDVYMKPILKLYYEQK